MRDRFFADLASWRRWLAENHATATEVSVGFWKRASGTPSITWPDSVDGALCFGWIDGVRQSIDLRRYRIRFTPRKPTSNWSLINVRRMEALIADGLVHERGLAAFRARDPARTGIYAYEREHAAFTPAQERALRADRAAWADWQARPPSYRRVATFWVVSAKQEATRARRLATLRECSAAGRPIGPLAVARSSPTRTAKPKAPAPDGRRARAPARRASTRG